MRVHLAILFVVVLTLQKAFGEAELSFNASWLERSCLAALVCFESPNTGSAEQNALSNEFLHYYIGFMHGINMMSLAIPGEVPPVFFEDMKTIDARKAIAKLYSYICSNRSRIPADAPAQHVFIAWYLTSHPKSTEREKRIVERLLDELSKKGPKTPRPTP